MAKSIIKTTISCKNIAPLKNLYKEITTRSIKMGVYANNGSGKTFISRLFRLVEKKQNAESESTHRYHPDNFLTFGEQCGSFLFNITDNNEVKENIEVSFKKGDEPSISSTNYIYHTFNQDYVDSNIRNEYYDKDGNISGFILGEGNINIEDDKKKLKDIEAKRVSLKKEFNNNIERFIKEDIDQIRDIKRLTEYKDYLNHDSVIKGYNREPLSVDKSLAELLSDYNKIKSVPENLENISQVKRIDDITHKLDEINTSLLKEYSLSTLADEFKQKIRTKQEFIETGLSLLNDKIDSCPFCEQKLQKGALELIDKYNKYITDTEAATTKDLNTKTVYLAEVIKLLQETAKSNSIIVAKFDKYKREYIPSSEGEFLEELETNEVINHIKSLINKLTVKLTDISKLVEVDDSTIKVIKNNIEAINTKILKNNDKISSINTKKNNISNESKKIRKDICKAAYNHLVATHSDTIKEIIELRDKYSELKKEIDVKKQQQKVEKRSIVADTITQVLNYFFNNKYTLDEETFRLKVNQKLLNEAQAQDVLSEGEKNIVAFAYYMGDTHLKIDQESDYEKLFFIIDDPISSMDYTYVYTMCGALRDLKSIIKNLNKERMIVLTHNIEFMRILSVNNIITKKLILSQGRLNNFNDKLTIPYINHLMDLYVIARKQIQPTHTTANSIRHVIETLNMLHNVSPSRGGIEKYMEDNFSDDINTYSLIQDLSHGAWRSEQQAVTAEAYQQVCEKIIDHVESIFEGHIKYCEENCDL